MAEALSFSLVSPERELFRGDVTSVVVPGTEGTFEVMAGHAPVMSTLSPGMVTIRQREGEKAFFVRGGFADVTRSGLTLLAEVAIPADELNGEVLAAEKDLVTRRLSENLSPEDRLNASRAEAVLSAY